MNRLLIPALFAAAALAACSREPKSQPNPVSSSSLALGSSDAGAMQLSSSSLAPDGGDTVVFKAKAPVVVDPAAVTQQIDVSFDSHFQMQAAPTLPEGWSATYYAGGTALAAAPSTPAAWSTVRRIVASGSYQADGVTNGNQNVVGISNAAPPPAAPSFSGGSAGDGWDVFFSPDRSKVYNIHHHDGPATIMCRIVSTSAACPGFPFALYHTDYRSTGYYDPATNHIWHATVNNSGQGGFECVDVSGALPQYCNPRFVTMATGMSAAYNNVTGAVAVGTELYGLDLVHGSLMCLDLAANGGAGAPCASQPYAGYTSTDIANSSIITAGGRVFTLGNNVVRCFDPATKGACAGTSWPRSTTRRLPLMAVPSADGSINDVCVESDCWSLSGGATTLPASFTSYIAVNGTGGWDPIFNKSTVSASRVFWSTGFRVLTCFDIATGAVCPGWPHGVPSLYSPTIDPTNDNCVWSNGDDGIIRIWDVTTGLSGCPSPPSTYYFKPSLSVPRLACDLNARVGTWDSFTLTNPPPSGYATARLTVKSSTGVAVPGWSNLLLNGNQPLSLAGLSVSDTGQSPVFEVKYTNLTDFSASTGRFRIVGQSPEVCWSGVANAACPGKVGLLPSPLPATSAASVFADGTVTVQGSGAQAFAGARIDLLAPNQTSASVCGGGLAGAVNNAQGAAVPNAVVSLLDTQGQPVLDDSGAAITATSTASGSYAFPSLLVGNYRVKFVTVPDYWAASTSTVVVGGSGTTAASGGVVISNLVAVTGGGASVVNAGFVGPIDSDADGLPDYVEKGPQPAQPLDSDNDGTPDYLAVDSDGDGMLDSLEVGANVLAPRDTDGDGTPDYRDHDSDGDGISDAIEAGGAQPRDTDGDGVPDWLSLDSDGDGVADAVERGAGPVPANTDGDGLPDYRDLDSDQDGIADAAEGIADTDADTVADRVDLDSDGDGIADLIETSIDRDGDGTGNWRDLDSDGDLIADQVETAADADGDGAANFLDLDSDGDTLADQVETAADADHDGVPNFLDLDADGDGIADQVEGAGDPDHDGQPNWLDPDSDGDGIPDAVENGSSSTPADQDGDGVPDYLSLDADGDTVSDAMEKGLAGQPVDSDGDGLPDYRDLDSDADGISDRLEANAIGAAIDTDEDGTPDRLDADSDADGIPDLVETGADRDGDGAGNWRDLDSDGDTLTDALETAADADHDGTPNFLDLDSDGDTLTDALETAADADHDGTPNFLDLDSDADGIADAVEGSGDPDADGMASWLDTDSDGDGILDAIEKGAGLALSDADQDGQADYLELDSDADGVPDAWEALPATTAPADTDHDGICDFRDGDSDGDGISDAIESGGAVPVDTDLDGVADLRDADSDGDGIVDRVEGAADPDHDGIASFRDLDSDADFIPDAVELSDDVDHDGLANAIDIDSDGDGVPDAIEAGFDPQHPRDFDRDGTPDFLDLDSDNDCRPDRLEAPAERNDAARPAAAASENCADPSDNACDVVRGVCTHGCTTDSSCGGAGSVCDAVTRFCTAGCRAHGVECSGTDLCTLSAASTDPTQGRCMTDSDGDGVSDADERTVGTNPSSIDSDGDGISDRLEGRVDTDGDGVIDALDTDADGDAISDAIERNVDSDGDGTPDYLDRDSDGDGLADAIERVVDSDGDGTPNYLDRDSDGDGLSDAEESAMHSSPVLADTDGDGLSDQFEAGAVPPRDSDGDGTPDLLDTDSDNDGIPDAQEHGDTDGDGISDSVDRDDDGDGIADAIEGMADTDGDGVPDRLDSDSDGDGVADADEGSADTDGDGVPNFRDLDSDNDCVADVAEGSAAASIAAAAPRQDTAKNCPAQAPVCQASTGQCVAADDPGKVNGGGGCSAAGSGPVAALAALAVLALGALRRRRGAAVAVVAVLASAPVLAQTAASAANTGTSHPAAAGSDWSYLDSLDFRGKLRPSARLMVGYEHDPVVVYNGDGTRRSAAVEHRVWVDVGASLVVLERVRVSINLPMVPYQGGQQSYLGGQQIAPAAHDGFGDLSVAADVRLFGRYGEAFTLAAGLLVTLPTGAAEDLLGDGRVSATPRLMAAGGASWFIWAAQLGFTLRHANLAGTVYGNELQFAASVGAKLFTERLFVGPEVFGFVPVGTSAASRPAGAELGVGVRYKVLSSLSVGVGVGAGIARSAGVPDVRVVGGITYSPAIGSAPAK
ncbi:MAG: hypothetical protein IPJ65_37380 [Archangiaceae bacterium]|nr:hypothetical protein [Archangiaceae bacterium]